MPEAFRSELDEKAALTLPRRYGVGVVPRGINQRLGSALGRTAVLCATLLLLGLCTAEGAGAFVYWANNNGTVGRAKLNGTAADQSFISGINGACGVAVDRHHIYWTDDASGRIGRAKLNGKGINRNFITGGSNPCGVTVNGSHVYWANNVVGGSIGRARLNGKGVDQTLISGMDHPCGVAVNRRHIYWGNRDTEAIGRASLEGMSVNQDFIPTASGPCGVAVSATHIYWANFITLDGSVGRANLKGKAVQQNFITGAGRPCGPAVEGAHVFWGNSLGTTIGRAGLGGAGVQKSFIGGAAHPCWLAVDLPRFRKVPGLHNRKVAVAKRSIRNHGFKVGAVKRTHSRRVARGRVIRQSPAPGTKHLVGTRVRLIVSSGP